MPFVPTAPGYYWAVCQHEHVASRFEVVELYWYSPWNLQPVGEGYHFDSFLYFEGPLRPPAIPLADVDAIRGRGHR